MVKILIIGHFGFKTHKLDGQIVKTRTIVELLSKVDFIDLRLIDTQEIRTNRLKILKVFKCILTTQHIIQIPAKDALTFIFPFVFILSKIKKVQFSLINIGGWLDIYLKKRFILRFMLKSIDNLFIETKLLKTEIENKYNFKNVIYLPNFRVHEFIPVHIYNSKQLNLVFMSRINKKKGIDLIFRMVDNFALSKDFDIRVDFFGPINPTDRVYFFNEIKSRKNIKYKGILHPKDIHKTLSKYDILLLPTKYFTEGFPGAILDAYISGIPVIVSKWKYSHEFVEHGKSGFIFPLNSEKMFHEYIKLLYYNKTLLKKMKIEAHLKGQEYSHEKIKIKLITSLLSNYNITNERVVYS
jgi:glycosyltransferase involved in cell wall biosynthesis